MTEIDEVNNIQVMNIYHNSPDLETTFYTKASMLTHDFEIVFQYIEIQLLRYLHCKDILRNVMNIRYKHGLCCGTPRNGIFMPVNIFIIL